MYKGQLYLDCKNGVYGVNTSSKRDGEFFPLPTDSFTGQIDYEYFTRHYKNVYEYVGKAGQIKMQEYWNDVTVLEMFSFVIRNPEYCLNINDGEFHVDRQESYEVTSMK